MNILNNLARDFYNKSMVENNTNFYLIDDLLFADMERERKRIFAKINQTIFPQELYQLIVSYIAKFAKKDDFKMYQEIVANMQLLVINTIKIPILNEPVLLKQRLLLDPISIIRSSHHFLAYYNKIEEIIQDSNLNVSSRRYRTILKKVANKQFLVKMLMICGH